MKASHRKDVIIARLIFAAICLFLIALIATIVITVNSKGGKKKEQDKVQQNAVSESETDSAGDSDTEIGAIYLPQQTTEGTEKTYVTTTSSVNMREKPDKNANIVTVIAQDVKLEFVSEDNGWTQVIFQGQTGYVSSDYVKSDMADSTIDSGTSGAANSGAATDIERMENMSETDKKTMNDAAANILTLEKTRSDFLKTKNRISDSQYAQMQQLEDEIPRAIKRLEKNESSLDVINKDLRYLEGEKVQFDIDGEYAKSRQRAFKVYAVLLVVFFAVVVAVCTLMQIVYGADTTIFMLIGALLSTVAGSFVLLTYQSYSDEVKSAAASKNKAVALENRVKIKYVSIKNAVDYTYEKYHVKNSKEFVYNYEQYLLAVKDKERFRRTNEDLEYNSKKLVSVLSKNDFYDARVWLNYTNAIVDHKEMVEQKHELIVRRQKLRGRMSCNVETITRLRREILSHRSELGDRIHEVNRILNKIAELDMEVQSED